MKSTFLLVIALIFKANLLFAQISDGATAPDFTFTDLSGNTQNLYTYLNAGKYVAIDVSATWCNPCWNYHTSGTMDSLYNLHDIPGDQTWKVFFIEGDGATTVDQLNGIGTTQGDWVTGTLFPIMNPTGTPLNDFKASYDVNSFPLLFLICPNKKIYHDFINASPRGTVSKWNYVASTCGPTGFDNIEDANPLTIYPNPATDHTVLYFSLNRLTELKLTITNIIGQTLETKKFGTLQAGDYSIRYDVSNLNAGIYFFTVSDGNNRFVRKKIVVQ